LLAAGRVADAADRLSALPRDETPELLRLRLSVELAAGAKAEAARTAARLAARARDPAHAEAARAAVTGLAALPSPGGARVEVPRLAADAPRGVVRAQGAGVEVGPAERALRERAVEAAAAPFACACCGMPLPRALPACPHCTATTPSRLREPGLQRELAAVSAVADEIEENEAHVARLVQRAADGDEEARDELVQVRAVGAAFARAVADPAARTAMVDVLRASGPDGVDALLAAGERARAGAGGASARDAAIEVVGAVVQSFGPSALPAFEARLDTEDRDLRKIVVDFYLGLDDPSCIAQVLERYPPIEVIQRLNQAPAARLQAWLSRVRPGDLVADVALVHPTVVPGA